MLGPSAGRVEMGDGCRAWHRAVPDLRGRRSDWGGGHVTPSDHPRALSPDRHAEQRPVGPLETPAVDLGGPSDPGLQAAETAPERPRSQDESVDLAAAPLQEVADR